jgi:hypothetical protein
MGILFLESGVAQAHAMVHYVPQPLFRTAGPVPLNSSGCSSSVCISLVGPSGYSALYYAQVTDVGEACLPDATEIYLFYGSSPSDVSVWSYAEVEVPPGECQYGEQFNLYQNFNNGFYFCGEISDLPGKPCKQVTGPPYYPG